MGRYEECEPCPDDYLLYGQNRGILFASVAGAAVLLPLFPTLPAPDAFRAALGLAIPLRRSNSTASAVYASAPLDRGSYSCTGLPWLGASARRMLRGMRSEEHTSELQSLRHLV